MLEKEDLSESVGRGIKVVIRHQPSIYRTLPGLGPSGGPGTRPEAGGLNQAIMKVLWDRHRKITAPGSPPAAAATSGATREN